MIYRFIPNNAVHVVSVSDFTQPIDVMVSQYENGQLQLCVYEHANVYKQNKFVLVVPRDHIPVPPGSDLAKLVDASKNAEAIPFEGGACFIMAFENEESVTAS